MRQEQTVTVRIFTERYGFFMPFADLFAEIGGQESPDDAPGEDEAEGEQPENTEPEKSEFFAEAKLVETDDRLEIIYEESVLTGMEGSLTTIGFAKDQLEIVSMVRQGFVDTALVFEKGRRHLTIYQTPFAEFELGVCARSVKNLLLSEGVIELDYVTELRGARAERCKMRIEIGGT